MSDIASVVFSAGYGRRFLPFSRFLPKPLFPFFNIPILERIISSVRSAGICDIFINTHHLGEMVSSFVSCNLARKFKDVSFHLFAEEELLDTGGTLHSLYSYLPETVLIHNCDTVSFFPLERLVDYHKKEGSLVTLLCVDDPKRNTLSVLPDGRIDRIVEPSGGAFCLTYAGIAVVSREVIRYIPEGKHPWVSFFAHLPRDRRSNVLCLQTESLWYEIGDINSYFSGHKDAIISGRGKQFGCREGLCLADNSLSGCFLSGFVVAGKNIAVSGSPSIRDAVIWSDSVISGDKENMIIAPFGEVKI
ncbi:hypothetical protein DRQ19_01665 [bacterium]|nr:MAG: hypothetical protein DRQ19_01665 [bacterium]